MFINALALPSKIRIAPRVFMLSRLPKAATSTCAVGKNLVTSKLYHGPLWALLILLSITDVSSAVSIIMDDSLHRLQQLHDEYTKIKSIHFTATTVGMLKGLTTKGSMEFWVSGDKWRADYRYGLPSGEQISLDLAFDGLRYQRLDHQVSVLTFRKGNLVKEPFALPIPLLSPISFLAPRLPANTGAKLQWADASDAELWNQELLKVSNTAATDRLNDEIRVKSFDGREYSSRVKFDASNPSLPIRIDRESDSPGLVASFEMSDYTNNPVGSSSVFLPRRVRISGIRDSQTVGSMLFEVHETQVNPTISPTVFVLDITQAETIYDEDARASIKSRGQVDRDVKKLVTGEESNRPVSTSAETTIGLPNTKATENGFLYSIPSQCWQIIAVVSIVVAVGCLVPLIHRRLRSAAGVRGK